MLEQISVWLVSLVQSTGYVGIFVATVLESFFAPIPSEVVLPTAGVAAQELGGWGAVLIFSLFAAFGNCIGTLPFFVVSRWGANDLLPKIIKRWGAFLLISQTDVDRAEKLFSKYGAPMVFFARLIPGIRSLIAFPAGLSKMSFGKYTLFTLAGSLVWNLLLISVGFLLADKIPQILAILAPVEKLVILILVLLVLIYIWKVVSRIRKLQMVAQDSSSS